jgi:hypothetical protein
MAKMACAQCGGAKKMKAGGEPTMRQIRKMDRQDKRYMKKYEKQKAEELMNSKRFKEGGMTGIVGMPKYGNNPRTQEGRMLKKGGAAGVKLKKADSGMQVKPGITRPLPPNTSGVRKKYAAGGATASFAPNRAVMASCKNGMVRDANGKCVMERKMQDGGPTSTRTRNTLSGGTRTRTVSGNTVNITKTDKAGNVIKNKTRNKMQGWSEDDYKVGGSTKAKRFAALAPPYDKATAADRIAGAKKNKRK